MSHQGKYVHELRMAKGYSLTTIAKSIGITAQMLSSIEIGKAKVPKKKLRDLVHVLGGDKWLMRHMLVKDFEEAMNKHLDCEIK